MDSFGTLILMGGGLDSSYLVANFIKTEYAKPIIGIHFNYGHPASCLERDAVSRIGGHLGVDVLYGHFDFPTAQAGCEIKGRNFLLAMAAVPFAIEHKCSQIALGVHRGNSYYDTTKHFLMDTQNLMDGYFGGMIQITAPLINLVKSEILELSKTEFPLDLIYSCEMGSNPQCGKCPSCKDRILVDAYN